MLFLNRNKEQEIVIGDGVITIKVFGTRGDRVYIGIEAPTDVRILRSELAPRPEPRERE